MNNRGNSENIKSDGNLREKTLNSLMGKAGNEQKDSPASKKQTSLLSFFSSPSPKRPSESDVLDKVSSSPIKKRNKNDSATPLIASSSFYEMISEGEMSEIIAMEKDFDSIINLSHSHKQVPSSLPIQVGSLDLESFKRTDADEGDPPSLDNVLVCHGRITDDQNNLVDLSTATDTRDTSTDRYSWLVNIRDIEGRKPGDDGYDPRTLFIPKSQWAKFTPFERQFWEIKSKLLDTVVFFKKGKFYELYENDADIGAKEFDLKMTDRVNMRMVGVPEATFDLWASRFVSAGYKIARVDQTETAIGKSIREKESENKAEKIIRRELTCILTAGTVTEPAMISPDSTSYCIAIKEDYSNLKDNNGKSQVKFGVSILDASTGKFLLGDFEDDVSRTILETVLMQIQPKEIVIEKGKVSPITRKSIKALLPSAIINEAISDKEFWSRTKTIDEIEANNYFAGDWPPTLLEMSHPSNGSLSFLAFGALLWYLQQLKLDKNLLSYKSFSPYNPLQYSDHLVLDGQTLLDLDIIPSTIRSSGLYSTDPKKGTLLSVIDYCQTPFGKRLLLNWLCHPLRSPREIERRYDVVDFLINNDELLDKVCQKLKVLTDLERSLSRIHSGAAKLKEFISTIDGFKIVLQIKDLLQDSVDNSLPDLLFELVNEIPSMADVINFFDNAFDRQIAQREGTVIPFKGVERDFDVAELQLQEIQTAFNNYLLQQEKSLKVRGLKYKDVGKELFQLEVPAEISVPKEFILMSKTKQYRRYWTPTIKELVKKYQEWEEKRTTSLRNVYSNLLRQFDDNSAIWRKAVVVISKIDCLVSLGKASILMAEPKCRPNLYESKEAYCKFEELRHPCISEDKLSSFIPNDVVLHNERIIILTGPNMGGKSTLLRQTCLAVILAQIGCYVPSRSCELSPVDRIFTRLGANDNIIAGQSTFMVELLDACKILKEATSKSLVILDELGRGTSTFDGMAIAHAVMFYLTQRINCIGLFATHYRPLACDFVNEHKVSCQFMSCHLDPDSKRVTFLYKLTPGISPKSYGMNVAAMAGISKSIIDEADRVADQFDDSMSVCLENRQNSYSRHLSRSIINSLLTV